MGQIHTAGYDTTVTVNANQSLEQGNVQITNWNHVFGTSFMTFLIFLNRFSDVRKSCLVQYLHIDSEGMGLFFLDMGTCPKELMKGKDNMV